MDYITIETLTKRVGENTLLQLLSEIPEAEHTAYLESVISRAESRVNGSASVRYAIPLPADDDQVEEWTLAIAENELYKRSSWPEIPEKIKDGFKQAVADLDKLATGKINIPAALNPKAAPGKDCSLRVMSNRSYMDEDSMGGF